MYTNIRKAAIPTYVTCILDENFGFNTPLTPKTIINNFRGLGKS